MDKSHHVVDNQPANICHQKGEKITEKKFFCIEMIFPGQQQTATDKQKKDGSGVSQRIEHMGSFPIDACDGKGFAANRRNMG